MMLPGLDGGARISAGATVAIPCQPGVRWMLCTPSAGRHRAIVSRWNDEPEKRDRAPVDLSEVAPISGWSEVYEPIEPHDHGWLQRESDTRIYWEESGNPAGRPALYLHGGPGSGLGSGAYRQRFDPVVYRIIGLD